MNIRFLLCTFLACCLFVVAPIVSAVDLDNESMIDGAGNILIPANAGTMDFSTGFVDTQPRLVRPSDPATTYWEMQGWVWNTNLGWVSLYCDSGLNQGLPCGGTNYGVKVDKVTGEWYGWAWGDNIGWVSFACAGGFNEGIGCGSEDYASTFQTALGPDLGDIEPAPGDVYSHWAWADSVGWLNLENLHADMLNLIIEEVDGTGDPSDFTNFELSEYTWVKVESNAPLGPYDAPFDKDNSPSANNAQDYSVMLHLADTSGNLIIDDGGVTVTVDVSLNWTDSVDNDQINNDGSFDANNSGAVQKALVDADMPYDGAASSINGVTGLYEGSTTSKAPTDSVNCSDDECWSYKSIYEAFGDDLGEDNIVLDSIDVTVTLNGGESVTFDIIPLGGSGDIEFVPIVDLIIWDFLEYEGSVDYLNYFDLLRNTPGFQRVVGYVGGSLTPTITMELDSGDPDVDLVFAVLGEDIDPANNIITLDEYGFGTQVIGHSTVQSAEKIDGAKARSVVTYSLSGDTIRYPSNGLPRTADSFLRTQTAEILSGEVNARGDTNLRQDAVITAVGTVVVSDVRDPIWNDYIGLTSGAPEYVGAGTLKCSGGNITATNGNVLHDDKLVQFVDTDLYLDFEAAGNECLTKYDYTVVVEGGDLFIESNYISATDNNIGIVIFDKEGDGGNLYVHDSVTDLVDIHLYSDGAMFRYTDTIGYCESYREPNYVSTTYCGNYFNPIPTLINQIYAKGTFVTDNCFGCSAKAPVEIGTGEILVNLTLENIGRARLYDLHYFSYYDSTSGVGATSSEVPAGKTGPIYFDYSEPDDLLFF